MKKILQRFQLNGSDKIPAAANATTPGVYALSNRLRDEYARVTGVFVVNESATDLAKVYFHLNIGGVEILPKEITLSLLEYNGNFSLKDTAYDFAADKIPARSSDFEMEFSNTQTANVELSVYFILEND